MCQGATPQFSIRYAIRYVSTLVFPDPAPARTKSGPSVCFTADSCSLFKIFSRSFMLSLLFPFSFSAPRSLCSCASPALSLYLVCSASGSHPLCFCTSSALLLYFTCFAPERTDPRPICISSFLCLSRASPAALLRPPTPSSSLKSRFGNHVLSLYFLYAILKIWTIRF